MSQEPNRQVRKGRSSMATFGLTIGLVIGGGVGIILGSLMDNIPMGIVFGAGGGMLVGLAFGTYLDSRHKG